MHNLAVHETVISLDRWSEVQLQLKVVVDLMHKGAIVLLRS